MKRKLDHILLGCVADDFTGASDAASFLAKQGIKTLLFNGVPRGTEEIEGCAAVVIALKTRSIPADEAVRDTLAAMRWLEEHGTEQFYIKYCSTFDSTPKGNIGPDIDAALEQYGIRYTLLCPSLPVNRRIVKDGVLIVDGKPIAEGHMAHHPLNPIWASGIPELMEPQGKYDCMIIGEELLSRTKEEILAEVERFGEGREHFYIVPDYTTDEQGRKIVEVFGENRLITGGSGILEHMAARYREEYDCRTGEELPTWTPGRGIALSGSCSTATCGQCQAYETEYPAIPVYPARILAGSQSAEEIWETVRSAGAGAGEIAQSAGKEAACQCAGVPEFLVYSAGATDPESRRYKDEEEAARASQALEETMAKLGKMAFDDGYTRIIVAGGETSGAVALALGFDAFIIGESIAPGVPVLIPLHNQNVRLALKSGNFGQRDFFARALSMTRDPKEAAPPKCGGMLDEACWIGKSLFDRGKTAGSSANLSFLYQGKVWITASGQCFGRLTEESFAVTDLDGNVLNGKKPSKELPLHLAMYKKAGSAVQAVIHTHSFYSVLWSCLPHGDSEDDVVPSYTPYLSMKLGKIRLVPYHRPGSEELFAAFRERAGEGNGYLLANHGPVVGGETLMEAFYGLEELEESARIAREFRDGGGRLIEE